MADGSKSANLIATNLGESLKPQSKEKAATKPASVGTDSTAEQKLIAEALHIEYGIENRVKYPVC